MRDEVATKPQKADLSRCFGCGCELTWRELADVGLLGHYCAACHRNAKDRAAAKQAREDGAGEEG